MAENQPSTSSLNTGPTATNDVEASEELLKQFVADALILKSSGQGSKLYDQLVGEVRRLKVEVCSRGVGVGHGGSHTDGPGSEQDAQNAKQLVALLRSVTRCLALVKQAYHEVLVTEIMDIRLWGVGSSVREAVLSFLCHAVAVNGSFIQGTLHVLVFSLVPPVVASVGGELVGGSAHGVGGPGAMTGGTSWSPSVEEVGIQVRSVTHLTCRDYLATLIGLIAEILFFAAFLAQGMPALTDVALHNDSGHGGRGDKTSDRTGADRRIPAASRACKQYAT